MTTKFEEIIENPMIFKKILDEVLHDWSGSYDIMPVEDPHDREIKSHEKFAKFCQKVRSSENGLRRCVKCDLDYSKKAGETGKPAYYLCHAGLMDLAVPIIVDGELIATIFCGQHRSTDKKIEKNGLERTKKTERELGIKNDELLKLREETPALSIDKITDIQEKLSEVATYVSNLGSRKLEAEKAKRALSLRLREAATIQEILLELSEVQDNVKAFWEKLSTVLKKICKTIGAEHGMFLTCKQTVLNSNKEGVVQAIANLSDDLLGESLQCNPLISKALANMQPIVEEIDNEYFSGFLFEKLRKITADNGGRKIAIVPIKLEPNHDGVMIFVLTNSRDMASGIEIEEEIGLLTQAGLHIATAFGNCLLYQKQKELANVQTDWLEDVSHQILAPITGILGQTENLARSYNSWQKNNPLRIENTLVNLVELSDWATRMTKNFAWVAKSTTHKREINLRLEEDVAGKLIGYARNVQGLARTRGVKTVHVDIDTVKYLNRKVLIDKNLFKQAIANLLDNAVKYASPRTEVVISSSFTPRQGTINIINYGIPILEAEAEIIFDRYYRTDAAKKKYSVGSGIGLGIAREILRLHGGDLSVIPSIQTVVGWRTVFVATLPLYKETN